MGVKIRFPITKKNLPRKKSALMGFSSHTKKCIINNNGFNRTGSAVATKGVFHSFPDTVKVRSATWNELPRLWRCS